MVQKVKAFELRTKSNEDLKKQLDSMKQELFQLRVQKVTGASAANLLNIKVIRKNIARINTVLVQKQRDELKKVYADAKFKPKDLRSKHTRAFRRSLKTYQLKKKLLKVQKKESNNPIRRFAVKLE